MKPSKPVFTDRELDLMDVLWDQGSATVPEMLKALADDSAYSTVSTLLRILVDKGYVGVEQEGRFHRYHPLVDRDTAAETALRRLTEKLFKGSTELALTHMASSADLNEEQIRRIQALLDRKLREEDEE